MMTQYRGMKRGFCRMICSYGFGLGHAGLLIRFSPDPEKETALRNWLSHELQPKLPAQRGLVSAHLFETARQPGLTVEQRIRGKDAAIDWVLLVSGYAADLVDELAGNALAAEELERHGATEIVSGIYQLAHSLTERESATPNFNV